MRILHIIPNLRRGGAERLVLTICKELSKRENIDVCIVTFSNQNEYPLYSKGLRWDVVPATYIPSITGNDKKDISDLQKYIDDFRPDIIHTHLWEAEIVSRQVEYPHAKWFSHLHNNTIELKKILIPFHKKDITNIYEKRIMLKRYKHYNNNFICVAEDSFKYLKENLPASFSNQIIKLHNAIDTSLFKNNNFSKTIFPENKIRLLTVGTLLKNKNQIFLVDVINELAQRGYNPTLDILGDGPNYQLIKHKIETLKLNDRIFLRGICEVEEYYHNSDIYVHATVHEAFGLVLIEAMAAGLPVVCIDGKGNRDIIENGKNGYIVNSLDPILFAKRIIEIMENKELYLSMSKASLEFALNFDIKNYTNKLIEIYSQKLVTG